MLLKYQEVPRSDFARRVSNIDCWSETSAAKKGQPRRMPTHKQRAFAFCRDQGSDQTWNPVSL